MLGREDDIYARQIDKEHRSKHMSVLPGPGVPMRVMVFRDHM